VATLGLVAIAVARVGTEAAVAAVVEALAVEVVVDVEVAAVAEVDGDEAFQDGQAEKHI
jgi:hypothetical protein